MIRLIHKPKTTSLAGNRRSAGTPTISSCAELEMGRDKRFVAVHRGGTLSKEDHRLLATWAADCAAHVLPVFEEHTSDNGGAERAVDNGGAERAVDNGGAERAVDGRPRSAVAVARGWARGEETVGAARGAAVAAHAAARDAADVAATAAARAAGHAVATAHMADHSLTAMNYALKAAKGAGRSPEEERAWAVERIPDGLRDLVLSALERKRF
jgi:hypothetical protein